MSLLECVSFVAWVTVSLLLVFQKNIVSRFLGIKLLGAAIVVALSFGFIPPETTLWVHLFFLFALVIFLVMGHRNFIVRKSYLIDKEKV